MFFLCILAQDVNFDASMNTRLLVKFENAVIRRETVITFMTFIHMQQLQKNCRSWFQASSGLKTLYHTKKGCSPPLDVEFLTIKLDCINSFYFLVVQVKDVGKTLKNWRCDMEYVQIHESVCRSACSTEASSVTFSKKRDKMTLKMCNCSSVTCVCTFVVHTEEPPIDEAEPSSDTKFTDAHVSRTEFRANCEIILDDSKQPIFVNRELLALYSPVFEAMIEGELRTRFRCRT